MKWWREHCLYLAQPAADAFLHACGAAHMHSQLKAAGTSLEVLRQNWEDITKASEAIAAAVHLPGIGAAMVKQGMKCGQIDGADG